MKPAIEKEMPKLAAPGAGLPKPELFIARLIFRWEKWRTDRARAVANFSRERDAILALVSGCGEADAAQRVLIPRLRGLEDSSRFWSVWMALDHLRIVNDAVAGVITALAAGRVPLGVVSTADVKPDAAVEGGIVAAFEESCRKFEQAAAAVPDLATAARYAHPWFGLLDAERWHFMAGFHMRLHRKQIESILARLSTGSGAA